MTTDTTYKRHDTLAEVLTIREMAAILDGLTLLSTFPPTKGRPESEQHLIWETRRMIDAALSQAMTNEYAGDYDYPEQEGEA